MSKETVAAVVATYFRALRAMDAAAWAATFAEDAVSHDPVGAPPHQGRAGVQTFASGIFPMFQSFGLTEEDVFICANTAAVKWKGQGVGKNGKSVTFYGIDVIEVNEQGKIQTVRAYWDPGPVMSTIAS